VSQLLIPDVAEGCCNNCANGRPVTDDPSKPKRGAFWRTLCGRTRPKSGRRWMPSGSDSPPPDAISAIAFKTSGRTAIDDAIVTMKEEISSKEGISS